MKPREWWIDTSLGEEHLRNGSHDSQIFFERDDGLTRVIEHSAYRKLLVEAKKLREAYSEAHSNDPYAVDGEALAAFNKFLEEL